MASTLKSQTGFVNKGDGGNLKGNVWRMHWVNGRVYCECGQGKNHLAITPEGLVGLEGLSIFILSCWEPWNTVFILMKVYILL
jgi:hypothetical protein